MENLQTKPNYINPKKDVISLERGKLPPQAIDLEQVVLGAMMIDKKGVDEIIDILSPEVFYKDAHQHIYDAVRALFENGEPIDLLTVSQQLKQMGKLDQAGGDYYLIQLTQKESMQNISMRIIWRIRYFFRRASVALLLRMCCRF